MIDAELEVGGPGNRLGHLVVPEGASGTVIFAHGSGSSRHSPRNRRVAESLNAAGMGTLLFDLLTADEEDDRDNVFDIELLAARLEAATGWFRHRCPDQTAGYFGASTGAAAALQAAAAGSDVAAIVSRGGRPDLAAGLDEVTAPTLLIVGELDPTVLDLNRTAEAQMQAAETELEVVAGAGHLFEEPGTLARVADLAQSWFSDHFPAG